MLVYILRRIAQSVLVMVAVAFVSFSVFRYIGDPTVNLLGQDASAQDRAELISRLGLDQPVPVQFVRFIGNLVQGEFGVSYRLARPVSEVIAERLPATLELAFVSGMFALIVGLALGVYTAIRRNGLLSRAVMAGSLIGVSLPTFLIGIGLIFLFSVSLGWLPSFGRGTTVNVGGWESGLLTESGLRAIILPAITLGFYQMTLIMRLVRADMLEVLRSDYIKFARARGLPERTIRFGHALRNTLIPVITIVGLQLGAIIAFSIVTETVFQWPGVGLLFITSVQFVDVPVIAAYLVLIALLYVIINLCVDLLYLLVDPRLRDAEAAARA